MLKGKEALFLSLSDLGKFFVCFLFFFSFFSSPTELYSIRSPSDFLWICWERGCRGVRLGWSRGTADIPKQGLRRSQWEEIQEISLFW